MDHLEEILRKGLRRGDAAARCGADQFVLLLPQADYDAICEKLKTDADGVASSIIKDVDASGNPVEPSGLPLTKVVVTVV